MMFYRSDDVLVWQAWCQYRKELKALQQAASTFAESLDAEPVYGASLYGQILVGIAPRHFDAREDKQLWTEPGYGGVRIPRQYVPKGQLRASARLHERFPDGRPDVDTDRARLAPVWESLGIDMSAIAKSGSTFFGYDGQFYFTTLLRAPNATVIEEREYMQAQQQSQAATPTR